MAIKKVSKNLINARVWINNHGDEERAGLFFLIDVFQPLTIFDAHQTVVHEL
jgi:hypothetical protein